MESRPGHQSPAGAGGEQQSTPAHQHDATRMRARRGSPELADTPQVPLCLVLRPCASPGFQSWTAPRTCVAYPGHNHANGSPSLLVHVRGRGVRKPPIRPLPCIVTAPRGAPASLKRGSEVDPGQALVFPADTEGARTDAPPWTLPGLAGQLASCSAGTGGAWLLEVSHYHATPGGNFILLLLKGEILLLSLWL